MTADLLDLSGLTIQSASHLKNSYGNIDIRNGVPTGYVYLNIFTDNPLAQCPARVKALVDFSGSTKRGWSPDLTNIVALDQLDTLVDSLEELNKQVNEGNLSSLCAQSSLDWRLRPSVLGHMLSRSVDDADLAQRLCDLFESSTPSAHRALLGLDPVLINRYPLNVLCAMTLALGDIWFKHAGPTIESLRARLSRDFAKIEMTLPLLQALLRKGVTTRGPVLINTLEAQAEKNLYALLAARPLRAALDVWLRDEPKYAKRFAKLVAQVLDIEDVDTLKKYTLLYDVLNEIPALYPVLPRTFWSQIKREFPISTYTAARALLETHTLTVIPQLAVSAIEPHSLFSRLCSAGRSHRRVFTTDMLYDLVDQGNHPLALIQCTKLTQLSRLLVGTAHKSELDLMTRAKTRYPVVKSVIEHSFFNNDKIDRHSYLAFLDSFNRISHPDQTLRFLGNLLPENLVAFHALSHRHEAATGMTLMQRIVGSPTKVLNPFGTRLSTPASSTNQSDTFTMLIELAADQQLCDNLIRYAQRKGYNSVNLHDYVNNALQRASHRLRSREKQPAQSFAIPPILFTRLKKAPELKLLSSDAELRTQGRSYRFCLGSNAYIQAGYSGDRFVQFKPSTETLDTWGLADDKVVAKGLVAHMDPELLLIKQIKGFANRNPSKTELEHFKSLLRSI